MNDELNPCGIPRRRYLGYTISWGQALIFTLHCYPYRHRCHVPRPTPTQHVPTRKSHADCIISIPISHRAEQERVKTAVSVVLPALACSKPCQDTWPGPCVFDSSQNWERARPSQSRRLPLFSPPWLLALYWNSLLRLSPLSGT